MAAAPRTPKTPAKTSTKATETQETDESGLGVKALRRVFAQGMGRTVADARDPVWPWISGKVGSRKTGDAPKVEVFNPPASAHGWVLVVADDQPFLTDTVSLAVRRHNPDLGGLWHPVVNVTRVRNKLTDAELGRATSRKSLEAWILVQVENINTEGVHAMVDDVRTSLAQARAAVRDYPTMRDKMAELANGFGKSEEREFLNWIADGNMILLGYRHYDYRSTKTGLVVKATPDTGLGIMAETTSAVTSEKLVSEVGSLGLYIDSHEHLVLSNTPEPSKVHRGVTMDYVGVMIRNTKGDVVGEHRFVGLYTSSAYTSAVQSIPLLRAKLANVIKAVNWPKGSYNSRTLQSVLDMWPRDELFLSDVDTLKRLATATVAVHERPDVAVLVRASAHEAAATVIVYLPLAKMHTRMREKIVLLLGDAFGFRVREFKVELGSGELARMVFRLPWKTGMDVSEADLTHRVRALVRGWDDDMQDAFVASLGAQQGILRWRQFATLVDVGYRSVTPVAMAVEDAAFVASGADQQVRLEERDGLRLRLLKRGGSWTLAELMPLVDSCGLKAISEETFKLGDVWVHDVLCAMPETPLTDANRAALIAVVDACLRDTLEEDSLNRLALGSALGVREIGVWRAWVAYLQQVDRRLDPRTVRQIVRARPDLARVLWELLVAEHDPAIANAKRKRLAAPLIAKMEAEILAMPTAEEERVWRTAFGVVQAILRTNVWQPGREAKFEALAFKLDCSKVPGMVEPRPWREIAVYHPHVEGVHLRGGPVARGGLRHSGRASDYRTEILGLMTAQMRKNTIIVPVGAKGGFFVRQGVPVEAYKLYIRALLSISDTYDTKNNVVPPRGVVRHDGDDPYLVVAADKGTAKFSDVANGEAIAADYWDGITGGFWLADAFASGGSKGYDHKDMGITARGAWVSVAHHLSGLGLTPSAERPAVLVGIGDMAGDVFGNGLLRDPHVQLVAAFNHMHIFLDPNPDPAVSFAERQRMFDAGLGWDGYDTKKISEGGGVFLRAAKRIDLSPQMQARLGIKASSIVPDELIKAILKAPVDVLWNGGIGTYIKASDESHLSAADKANDDVRVDGASVRAKVIGEGGNLGITARGRVELARRGVQLNTDALDNSAGVDTSDHEVNLKILLQLVMRQGKMDEAGRVKLLRSMTDDVAVQVLRDNTQQNLAVTMDCAEDEGYHLELQSWQDKLVREDIVDPIVDCLPSLRDLKARPEALYTRPEMCALLAGTKAWLRAEILKDHELLDSPMLKPLLAWYFPRSLQDKYAAQIEKHPLAHNIIATVLANLLVNRLGILSIPRLMNDFEVSARDAVRALGVAIVISDLAGLWAQLENLHTLPLKTTLAVSRRLKVVSGILAAWVVRHGQPVDVATWIGTLHKPVQEIVNLLPKALKGRPEMARWADEWESMGLPAPMAGRLALLSPLVVAPDVAMLSAELKKPLTDVLGTHLRVGESLKLPALVRKVRTMPVPDAWTRQAVQAMGQELFSRQTAMSRRLLRTNQTVDGWLDGCGDAMERYQSLVRDIGRSKELSVAMLSVVLGRLRELES
ncbi:MAG: hypothetical protein DI585_00865 [Pseudomonas fluorescens]|nr:MAG: hypothetical protein DI585_00865 [Pseudomonas fluorescens]